VVVVAVLAVVVVVVVVVLVAVVVSAVVAASDESPPASATEDVKPTTPITRRASAPSPKGRERGGAAPAPRLIALRCTPRDLSARERVPTTPGRTS
jgi:hypothetical protein